MTIFCDFFKHVRENEPENWNKLCNSNEIYGINRVAFESMVDEEIENGNSR